MRQSFRFSPLVGLDGSRQAEEVDTPAIPMRGGYNVEAVDGEWHSRYGRMTLETGSEDEIACIASLPWFWMVSTEKKVYIANPWYALAIDPGTGLVDNVTSKKETGVLLFTNGNTTALVANGFANIAVNDLIFYGSSTGPDFTTCYRVLFVGTDGGFGVPVTLDRAFTGTSGTSACRSVAPIVAPVADPDTSAGENWTPVDTRCKQGIKGGACLFDQLVTETGTTPSLEAQRTYLVVASEYSDAPFAVKLDPVDEADQDAPVLDWYKDRTGSDAGAAITRPLYPCAASGRLIMAHAPDHNGAFATRTIWYSQAGNLYRWYTGISGGVSGANYVTFDQETDYEITGIAALGNGFVVYRQLSQMIASPTGSGRAPFRFSENRQGIGLNVPGGVVEANGVHYFASQAGPAVFDGTRVTVLGDQMRLHLERNGFWDSGIYKVCHDREQRQVLFLADNPVHQDSVEPFVRDESEPFKFPFITPAGESAATASTRIGVFNRTNPVLVHDYGRESWWFENYPTMAFVSSDTTAGIVQGTGSSRAMRMDGTFQDWRNAAEFTKDGRTLAWTGSGYVQESPFPVDAFVETPWISFGTLERKQITKMIVQTRSWGGEDVGTGVTTGATPILAFRCQIMTNGDAKNVRDTVQATHTWEEMRTGPSQGIVFDENRQYSLMTFELSPRVTGQSFKFRFLNKPTGSEYQGPLRIAGIEVFFDQQEGNRPFSTTTRN